MIQHKVDEDVQKKTKQSKVTKTRIDQTNKEVYPKFSKIIMQGKWNLCTRNLNTIKRIGQLHIPLAAQVSAPR